MAIPFILPRDTAGPGVLVPIETSRPLTPGGRDVRHYEFNIKGTGLSYEAGDALAVFSTNGADRVDAFLDWCTPPPSPLLLSPQLRRLRHGRTASLAPLPPPAPFHRDPSTSRYGMARGDVVSVNKGTIALPNHFTAGQLFTESLDIFGRPKRSFIEMMSLLATAPDEKQVCSISPQALR